MTRFGIDYAWGRPSMTALHKAGVLFVCRYLAGGRGGGKELTAGEVHTLADAGIPIVSIFETDGRDMRSGHAAGVADARAALAEARALGQPDDRPIYFGNDDYDAPPSDQAAINQYLDGCAEVVTRPRVGMYGGYWPLSRAMHAGHAVWGWQTYAWSGSNWYAGAHIHQYSNNHVLDGVSVDYDQAVKTDFGAWLPESAPPTTDRTKKIMDSFPTLKIGATGEDVRTIQALLNVRSSGQPITIDGQFGTATETRVKQEQAAYHLTADGIVGPHTLSVLLCRKDVV